VFLLSGLRDLGYMSARQPGGRFVPLIRHGCAADGTGFLAMRIRGLTLICVGALFALGATSFANASERVVRVDRGRTASIESAPRAEAPKKKKPTRTAKTAKANTAANDAGPLENNGELRSEKEVQPNIFKAIFGGGKPQLLPQTQELDAALRVKEEKRPFHVKSEFEPQSVPYSGYPRGTIIIDTGKKFLYLKESSNTARRYPIALGREGLQFKGAGKIGDKQEWPRWIPTLDMQKREPKHYGQYKDGMPGGLTNPLGARAMYVYQGGRDTHIRIHGTIQPWTVGTSASNGCFRMYNDQVMDLYRRVKVGTPVVVL
jgi:lipoprotein-anchoring transpeptidase ErfK/SrfK